MRKKILRLILIGGITTASCSFIGGLFAPTATHTPTLTNTPTPTPTPTNTPTPSPTPVPELEFGEPVTVDGGIFSYSPVTGLSITEGLGEVEFATRDQGFTIILNGSFRRDLVSSEQAVEEIALMMRGYMSNYSSEGPYSYTIDGREGHAMDATWEMAWVSYTGQWVAVTNDDGQLFVALATSSDDDGGSSGYWATEGKRMVEGILARVTLIEVSQEEANQGCTVSDDPTYGYSEDNPIKVGGDAFWGAYRERVYLDNLLGPNGEITIFNHVRYGLLGTVTNLEMYQVNIQGGKTVELYIDMYSYEALFAPVGFTCRGEFALGEP